MKKQDESLKQACAAARVAARKAARAAAPFMRVASVWIDADDMEQEAALTTIARWSKYDAQRGTPGAFGCLVGWSRSKDILKSIRREVRPLRDEAGRILPPLSLSAPTNQGRHRHRTFEETVPHDGASPLEDSCTDALARAVRKAVDEALSPVYRAYARELLVDADPKEAAAATGSGREARLLLRGVQAQMRARAPELETAWL